MSEETPKCEATNQYVRITVSVWPKTYRKQGQRTSPDDLDRCPDPTLMRLEISEAELLAAEFARSPYTFEQEAAKSIKAALHEHELQVIMEDMAHEENQG